MESSTFIEVTEATINRMLDGMASQGWERSVNESGTCSYINESGSRCAVGWMVEPHQAERFEEGGGSVIDLFDHELIEVDDDDFQFLTQLQECHDRLTTPASREKAIRNLCSEFLESKRSSDVITEG